MGSVEAKSDLTYVKQTIVGPTWTLFGLGFLNNLESMGEEANCPSTPNWPISSQKMMKLDVDTLWVKIFSN